MITATTWVPRGFAAQFPQRYDIDEKEFERIADLARLHLEDAKEGLEEAEAAGSDGRKEEEEGEKNGESNGAAAEAVDKDEDMKEVGDEKQREFVSLSLYTSNCPLKSGFSGMGMFGNIKGLAYYQPGEQDPYITMDLQDDDEEREELQVLGTDNLLLVAKTEDDIAHLEVYVYEDEADNLYVHHDIMLPAIPLCLEWLDIPVGGASVLENKDARGNYAAIGTMDPDIEIWNLDLVDCLFPNAILGASSEPSPASVSKSKKKKGKKKKSPKVNDNYHIDAVLSLSGNRQHRNLLASASADKTVKLWDLSTTKCAKSYNSLHTDKICALSWHPSSATTILSGSYDRTIVWSDMRSPDPTSTNPRWGVDADVEDVRWDPHNDHYFYVSTESGNLYLYDSRNSPPASTLAQSKPVWTLNAHDKSLSAFDVNPVIPGFIVTASVDRSVKLWNARAENTGGGPAMVVSRDFDLGKIFSARFAPDKEVGFRLAVAGSKGIVKVWDTSTNAGVRRAFAGRVAGVVGEEREERVVGAVEDSSDGSDEEEDGGVTVGGGDGEGPDGWESMEEE
ncbi:unnamed protein product [Tuber melanosporum]|uniref:(Perigord truffle) hypothetical protein n=1 Tax=Tuber melanosporum (strain Mel28) TaxID=656061 RepID=D5GJP6_TUBMM|nr:uncharacterized protein GSTUM_00009114001 [Tuber melanosporum]CAZ84739.1 unnamed protein product [Tuber melanosporum]